MNASVELKNSLKLNILLNMSLSMSMTSFGKTVQYNINNKYEILQEKKILQNIRTVTYLKFYICITE